MLNALDLFCRRGGLPIGFQKAGINILFGIDAWQGTITTFNHNHKNSKGIESELDGKNVDLIVGGQPCQVFPVAGK